jgi:hypothetical protein
VDGAVQEDRQDPFEPNELMPYDFKGKYAYKKGTGEKLPKKQAIAILIAEKKKKNG